MEKEIIKKIFEKKPDKWGLSGNEAMWQEMAMILSMDKIPETPDDLKKLIAESFAELAGKEINSPEIIRVERYDNGGGFSRGMVSGDWWLTSAIPLLLKNFEELKNDDGLV